MDTAHVICPSCGQPNPQGKRFCGDCGAPLPAAGPACGSLNPADKRFCGECGASGEVYLGELGRGPQQDVRAVGPAINPAAWQGHGIYRYARPFL